MARSQLRSLHPSERGFTLVELMTVVVIVGILATLAIAMMRRHVIAARTNDARVGVMALRSAEGSFKAGNGRYLECSDRADPKYYPTQVFSETVWHWDQAHPDAAKWKMLGVARNSPTRFGFILHAGLPGEDIPKPQSATVPLPPVPDNWYVIQFAGDVDGNGSDSTTGFATSWKSEIYFASEE